MSPHTETDCSEHPAQAQDRDLWRQDRMEAQAMPTDGVLQDTAGRDRPCGSPQVDHNETLTLRDAVARFDAKALRSTSSPVNLPPFEGRGEDKEQLAEAAAG